MPTKKKSIYYARKFLNRPRHHAGAFVIAEVKEERWTYKTKNKQERERVNLDVTLEISDCSRHIFLDLDTDTKRNRANAIRKLDTLISTLTELRGSLEGWFEENPPQGQRY